MSERPIGFAGKRGHLWALLGTWAVPVIMGCAYAVLASLAETDATGKSWMAIGFAFVLLLWFLFRLLSGHAALARAVAVGDTDRVLEVTAAELPRTRGAAARAELVLARAKAFEQRGDVVSAEAALADLAPDALSPATRARVVLVAGTVRVAAALAANDVTSARGALDRDVAPNERALDRRRDPIAINHARLAHAGVLVAEGDRDRARAVLDQVTRDVLAGSAQRDAATSLLARC